MNSRCFIPEPGSFWRWSWSGLACYRTIRVLIQTSIHFSFCLLCKLELHCVCRKHLGLHKSLGKMAPVVEDIPCREAAGFAGFDICIYTSTCTYQDPAMHVHTSILYIYYHIYTRTRTCTYRHTYIHTYILPVKRFLFPSSATCVIMVVIETHG